MPVNTLKRKSARQSIGIKSLFGIKKWSSNSAESTVAVRPAPSPPYQEPSITATKNREKWLGSARQGISFVTPNAKPTRKIAVVYRSKAGRSLINMRLHRRENLGSGDAATSFGPVRGKAMLIERG